MGLGGFEIWQLHNDVCFSGRGASHDAADEPDDDRETLEGLGGHTDLLQDVTVEIGDIGRGLFEDVERFGAGLRDSWNKLVGDHDGSGRDEFARAYERYLLSGEELESREPEQHGFMRDHVFFGSSFEPRFGYYDYDSVGRQIEVTGNGTWVVASGDKIA